MGRTPIGEEKLSNAEKQKQYCEMQDKEVQEKKTGYEKPSAVKI